MSMEKTEVLRNLSPGERGKGGGIPSGAQFTRILPGVGAVFVDNALG